MKNNVVIYHNPRCSKSRQTLALLQERNIDPEIVEYLQQPLKSTEIQSILEKLNLTVNEILRNGEKIYKEMDLKNQNDKQCIQAIVDNPILLQRPIVVSGNQAVIGRPPENINKLFD